MTEERLVTYQFVIMESNMTAGIMETMVIMVVAIECKPGTL
jgi:hypothetical protein